MNRNKTILVIEQELSVLEGLRSILEGEGYSVVSSFSSRRLEEVLLGRNPDLAIINVNLPKTFGLNILRRAKELFPKMPVIAMSLYNNSLRANELKRLGASGFILNPFDGEGVKLKIEQALKR